jgi:peroxidase
MKLLLISAILLLIDFSYATIKVTTPYDQQMYNTRTATPELDRKLALILAKIPASSNVTGYTRKLAATKGGEAYMDSKYITLWNSGSPSAYQQNLAATVSLKAYKRLLRESETSAGGSTKTLGYVKMPESFCAKDDEYNCDEQSPYRTADGSCNNYRFPSWGKSETVYKRFLENAYDDYVSVPRIRSVVEGAYLPSPRRVALVVHQPYVQFSEWTDLFLWFGQSIVHDASLIAATTEYNGAPKSCTCNSPDPACFNIPIPEDDYHNKDQECIPFLRSAAGLREDQCYSGPREPINLQTHWLDLSNIYGSNPAQAANVRLFEGGLLKYSLHPESDKHQLPRRPGSDCPSYSKRLEKCFVAGDPRAEDNAFLTSIHALFLREHNRVAYELASLNPQWDDETLYQEARRIVTAEYQHIIFSDYLPNLIGRENAAEYGLMPLKNGYTYEYDGNIFPSVINEYSTAAMRFCHALVPHHLQKATSNYELFHEKKTNYYIFNTTLSFYYPDAPLRGSIVQPSYYPSPQVNYDLNNYLFDGIFPDSRRFSLPALNIQRGRDHGLPSYNEFRRECGLKYAYSFDDLDNIPPYVIERLRSVYADVNDIDLWSGIVSEYPIKEAVLGPTAACIVARQYKDWKVADQWYYEAGDNEWIRFTPRQLSEIRKSLLARLLCDNLDITFVQKWPFLVANYENNELIDCNDIPRVDLSAWKYYY